MLKFDLGNFRFQDEVSWAFKMFDADNSGVIVVEEIHEAVKVNLTKMTKIPFQYFFLLQSVWMILDGMGDAIDGTVDEISESIYQRLLLHDHKQV